MLLLVDQLCSRPLGLSALSAPSTACKPRHGLRGGCDEVLLAGKRLNKILQLATETANRDIVLRFGCMARACPESSRRNASRAPPRRRRYPVAEWAIFDRDHELQSRPDIGDGADFDVDQAGSDAALPHDVFVEVGDSRGFLRPADPEHPGRRQRLAAGQNRAPGRRAIWQRGK